MSRSFVSRIGFSRLAHRLVLAGLVFSLWQCKSAGIDPAVAPGGQATAAEVAAVNSVDPGVFMAGTYVATWLAWRKTYGNITEGQDWAYAPDPAFIRGDYKLIVEPVTGRSDSVRIFLDGSGHGPDFKRTPVGTFWVGKGLDAGTRNSTYSTNYPVRDKYSIDDTPRIYFGRLALLDKTVYTFDINLTQFLGRTGPSYTWLVPDLAIQLTNILYPNFEYVPLFKAKFRRVSPALVKDPYKY